jgi:TonB-linked SusC/RagA family outer membrane protein
MRLTTVILIASLIQVSAATFGQRITLNQRNIPLESVLKEIRKQSGFDIYYDTKAISKMQRIDVSITNATVEDAIKNVLNGLKLTYRIEGKTVAIKKVDEPSFLDNLIYRFNAIDIRGRVIDSDKEEPLVGATVRVKGTNNAVSTDEKGFFFLRGVDEKAIIEISFIGYQPKQITANEIRTNTDIRLALNPSVLEEVQVINTGYQTLTKERSAGSFAKPDINIVQNRSSSMNILQRLDGLVAGLTVNNAPGASENQFLIRGLSTVGLPNPQSGASYIGTNRNPLYVVDGVPMDDVSSVNPQDVADITILKDATAASIWGARASNGVIVITTKRGTQGNKLAIQYDAFINFQGKPDLDYIPTLNSQQFIQATKDMYLNDPANSAFTANPWETVSTYTNLGSAGVAPHEMILYNLKRGLITNTQANLSLDSLAYISNTQHIKDLWYRNAALMNHTVSLSGGGDMYAFYGSGTYTNTQSNRPGEKNDTYKVNLRQDFTLGKRVQLSLITDLTNTVGAAKRGIEIDNRFYPYQLFQDANGNNLSMPYMTQLSEGTRIDFQNRSRINLNYNPLDELNSGYTKNNGFLSRNILGLNVKLIEGLKFEGTYGFIKGNSKTQNYDDQNSYKVRSELVQFTVAETAASTPVYHLPAEGGTYSLSNQNQQNWTIRNQLAYNKTWNNDLHQLSLLAGQEAQEQYNTFNGSTVRGYNELLQTYGSVNYSTLRTAGVFGTVMPNNEVMSLLGDDAFTTYEARTRFVSYYANAAYTYNRKYSINGSFRIDKSNLFGLDKSAQNKPVWSVGGKWIMSEETFLKDIPWLDNFALRATYGLTGNSPAPGTAASSDILQAQSSGFLPGGKGIRLATPANPKLTWENTKTINIGLDFAVLKSRLNGSVDLYQKKTENLLGNVPTNSYTGYSSIIGNLGDLQNRGIELSLNSVNILHDNFSWSTLFNIAYNRNVITKINVNTPATTGRQRAQENYVAGYPAFALFAYQYAGLDNLGDPQIRLADGTATKTPNIARPEDMSFMGSFQPVWSGGLSNTFNYKSFGLSVNTVFNLGNVMRKEVAFGQSPYSGRLTHSNLTYSGFTTGNLPANFANRWKKTGDEVSTDIPSYVADNSLSTTRRDVSYYALADVNVVSASFIKLRDITLSYSLPQSLVKRIHTDQISFRAQVSNLMLWKANKDGIDPEFQDAISGTRFLRANQGAVTFGVNVKF